MGGWGEEGRQSEKKRRTGKEKRRTGKEKQEECEREKKEGRWDAKEGQFKRNGNEVFEVEVRRGNDGGLGKGKNKNGE